MKKAFRKKILGLVFAAFFVAGTIVVSVSLSDKEQVGEVQAIENVDDIPQTASAEYFSTYAVGETFAINPYEIVIDGETQNTYAVLQKDYRVYASLTPDDGGITYKFTEAGEYNLLYYYLTKTQAREVVRHIAFTVSAEQAYFDVAFQNEYTLNSVISVDAKCVQAGNSVNAIVQVLSPFGEDVEISNGELTVTQNGVYTINYSAEINGETVSKTYYIRVVSNVQSYKDYFSSVSGVRELQNDRQAQDFAQPGSGVEITMDAIGEFRFNNIIDLNTLTKSDELIKMLPLSEGEYGTISEFRIKLIDVYDSKNVIEYVFNKRDSKTTWIGTWTYCNVLYKNVKYAINYNKDNEMFIDGFYGVGTRVCCDANRLKNSYAAGMYYGYTPWVRCQADYADKAFYVYGNGSFVYPTQMQVVDLDEAWQVGYGNEWSGFTTGEVYLQVQMNASGNQTGCIVQEVAGQKLYGEMKDTGKPSLYFAEEENGFLPDGLTGKAYPFPKVRYTNDVMEGRTDYPDYEITKLEYEVAPNLKYNDVTLSSQTEFTPERAGTYRVTYQVVDESGNVGERQMRFAVKDDFVSKGVDYDLSGDLCVGNTITIPTLTPKGFSYLTKREESVSYNGVEYVDKAGEELFLDKAGTIVIKCAYKDYLGNTYETENEYEVVAKDEVVTKLKGVIPKYALKGRTIVLPDYSAINYYKSENVAWTLTVGGTQVDTKTREVTIGGEHDEMLDVVYSANGVEERYQIKVIDAKYYSDRFYTTAGEIAMTNEEDYVSFAVDDDAEMEYIFPLIFTKNDQKVDFKFNFSAIANGFDSVDVYFQDYLNPNQEIFLRLEQTETGVTAQVNGTGEKFPIVSDTQHDAYKLTYDQFNKAFQFKTNATVKTALNGERFQGFTSNRVSLRFVFNGVRANTELRIYQLGVLTCKSTFKDGQLAEVVDSIFPVLVSERSYLDNSFTYGTTAVIPAMEARTMLSGACTLSLTITAPSGEKLLSKVNGYNDYEIELTEYGTYTIEYVVPFRKTTYKYKYNFEVYKDELPEIELADSLQDTYSFGERLTFPDVAVTGATTGYKVEYFLVYPSGLTTILDDTKTVTLDKYGTYVLRVLVTDEHNVVSKSWKFKVEG